MRSVGSVLWIKLIGTGIERVRLDSVERVEFTTSDGRNVSAEIVGWSKGVYRLSTEQGPLEVTVRDGQVVAVVGEAGGDTSDQADAESPAAPSRRRRLLQNDCRLHGRRLRLLKRARRGF